MAADYRRDCSEQPTACKRKNGQNKTPNPDGRRASNCLRNSQRRGGWRVVCHRAVVMKLGGEIKTRRLSVRDGYAFTPQHGKESKMPDEQLTGQLVLATSY